MKIKKITILLFFVLFLYSCSGAKDALQGKKRSDNSDEFLVEKKNPLTVPPDLMSYQYHWIKKKPKLMIRKILKKF